MVESGASTNYSNDHSIPTGDGSTLGLIERYNSCYGLIVQQLDFVKSKLKFTKENLFSRPGKIILRGKSLVWGIY